MSKRVANLLWLPYSFDPFRVIAVSPCWFVALVYKVFKSLSQKHIGLGKNLLNVHLVNRFSGRKRVVSIWSNNVQGVSLHLLCASTRVGLYPMVEEQVGPES